MTPQPTTSLADHRIDDLLHALNATEAPAGIEQRISARLAQAAEARTKSATPDSNPPSYRSVILSAVKAPRSLLAPAKLYTAAALTLLLTLTTIATLHHHSTTQSQVTHLRDSTTIANAATAHNATTPILQPVKLRFHHPNLTTASTLTATRPSSLSPSAQDDPDAIALAETLAPSRPAPPMALTAQEQLLASAARPGQPLQLAALDQARAPALHAAAEAREDARIRRYIHAMLAPFALSDALSPNRIAEPREVSTSTPAPHPPLALTN